MTERLTFLEALAIAGRIRRVRRVFEDTGTKDSWGRYVRNKDCGQLIDETGTLWWPSVEGQDLKVWEVEAEKPKPVFVWGACDKKDGYSGLYFTRPTPDNQRDWEESRGHSEGEFLNLFPTDKPQLFELIPVSEDGD